MATEKSKTKYGNYSWRIFVGLAYVAIVVGLLSAATQFETIALAALVQIYAGILYNFSVLGFEIWHLRAFPRSSEPLGRQFFIMRSCGVCQQMLYNSRLRLGMERCESFPE